MNDYVSIMGFSISILFNWKVHNDDLKEVDLFGEECKFRRKEGKYLSPPSVALGVDIRNSSMQSLIVFTYCKDGEFRKAQLNSKSGVSQLP
jgi:hypothetical protein